MQGSAAFKIKSAIKLPTINNTPLITKLAMTKYWSLANRTYARCNLNPDYFVGVIHVACFPKGITPTFVLFCVSPG